MTFLGNVKYVMLLGNVKKSNLTCVLTRMCYVASAFPDKLFNHALKWKAVFLLFRSISVSRLLREKKVIRM